MIPYEVLNIGHSNVKPIQKVYLLENVQGFVVFCFVVVMILFLVDSHNALTHVLQGYFAGIGVIIWLPQCQWSNPEGHGLNNLTSNHNKITQIKKFAYSLESTAS